MRRRTVESLSTVLLEGPEQDGGAIGILISHQKILLFGSNNKKLNKKHSRKLSPIDLFLTLSTLLDTSNDARNCSLWLQSEQSHWAKAPTHSDTEEANQTRCILVQLSKVATTKSGQSIGMR